MLLPWRGVDVLRGLFSRVADGERSRESVGGRGGDLGRVWDGRLERVGEVVGEYEGYLALGAGGLRVDAD